MNYEEIFRERGGAYHHAMQRWPEARRDEFLQPIACAQLRAGETVIDVPAGGGYLKQYLPDFCHWRGHEPCASFREPGSGAGDVDLLPLPWPTASADVAISIAGVHHLADKRPVFRELHRVLRPGGRLVLADVRAASAVAEFLDQFVDRHNSTGHRGDYLDETTPSTLEDCGLNVERSESLRYCWWFSDPLEMGAFCKLLFDMRQVADEEVADAIASRLGVQRQGQRIGMNWELTAIVCSR